MKRFIFVAGVVVVSAVLGYLTLSTGTSQVTTDIPEEQFEVAVVADMTLRYSAQPDGYVFVDRGREMTNTSIAHATFFTAEDYAWFSNPGFIGEAPPSLAIEVFPNTEQLTAEAWAQQNPLLSNFELDQRSAVTSYLLDEVEGIHYSVSGLYRLDMYVFAYGEAIYVIGASYNEIGDSYHEGYADILWYATFE